MIIAVLQQELLNYTKFLLLKLDALNSLKLWLRAWVKDVAGTRWRAVSVKSRAQAATNSVPNCAIEVEEEAYGVPVVSGWASAYRLAAADIMALGVGGGGIILA